MNRPVFHFALSERSMSQWFARTPARGVPRAFLVMLAVWAGSGPHETLAQCEADRLNASDAAARDRLGGSVSISGDVVVVGAPFDDDVGKDGGSAYVFRRDGLHWVEETKLTASDGSTDDRFGTSVCASPNRIVVGAKRAGPGAAYVFRKDSAGWVEEDKLTASDAVWDDNFGVSVSCADDVIIVGNNSTNSYRDYPGSAYIFRREGARWHEEVILSASDSVENDYFGSVVSLWGDRVVVGAPGVNDAAYVFRYEGSAWREEARLTASIDYPHQSFGSAVAIFEDTILVADEYSYYTEEPGVVYVFGHDGSGWVEEAVLTASDEEDNVWFGRFVSLSGDIAVVGAHREGAPYPPGLAPYSSAYVFRRDGANWSEPTKLTASDALEYDGFGESVCISGDRLAVGAPGRDNTASRSGAAYVFELSGPDCDRNSVCDERDITDGTSPDCNENLVPDACDIAARISNDCNANNVPDECEIHDDSTASGGPFFCSVDCDADCNINGIPDECEKDCNGNVIPDDCDVSPFDPDGNSEVSKDCNDNGVPDECERDCNDNGVPDDCDVSPTDPDGDGEVSDDCNANGVPDECERDCNQNGVPDECDILPTDPDGNGNISEDCNENMVPDECEIADGTSYDCNLNGVPDSCDIATGHSVDKDDNGMPDECNRVRYVDADSTGPVHDGSSWCTAYLYVQDALAEAAGFAGSFTEIRVAQGVYRPDKGTGQTPGDRDATFQLLSNVALRGGYAGGGAVDSDKRDVDLHETSLTGDLNGDDGPDFSNNIENSYHVVTGSNTSSLSVLDGFTITAGNATAENWPNHSGGGMLVEAGDPTIIACTFRGNRGTWGGGMANFNNRATLTDCSFIGNAAVADNGAAGGGMYNQTASPRLTNCVFRENSARNYSGGGMCNASGSRPKLWDCTFDANSAGRGGGMSIHAGSRPQLTNCTFRANEASGRGGGMYTECRYDTPGMMLANCTFLGNRAADGGGMYNAAKCVPILTNCRFVWNRASSRGGGVHNNFESSPTLTNCTFSANRAFGGGGMFNGNGSNPTVSHGTFSDNRAIGRAIRNDGSHPILTNCVLWGGSYQIWNEDGSTISVTYSDVQGGWPGDGNVDEDPLYVDSDGEDDIPGTLDDNLRLMPDSPAINAGDPDFVPEPGEADLDGHARVLCGRVDMGAYEFGIGDYDCDQSVDLTDFASWSACATGPSQTGFPNDCEAFNFDADDDIDLRDFAGFQVVLVE